MRRQVRMLFTSLILVSVVAAQAFAQSPSQATAPQAQDPSLTGRWRLTFGFNGDVERNLVFDSQAKGVGSFLLLDTGSDNRPASAPLPAVWSQLANGRVSFSGDAELPIGTCCREIGTLIFKGKFNTSDSISGKLIFVTSVDEDESPYKLRSVVGTFTATRQAK